MRLLKKIVLTFLGVLVLALLAGYIYFDQKFTPEKNYLIVDKESGFIPFKWLGSKKNVLLLPIHFSNDTIIYYLQFDTGSPTTVFYSNSIKKISQISINNEVAKASFYCGKTKIISDKFKIYNLGNNNKNNDSLKIIGTIGADILENRKTIINFKENYIALNLSKMPIQFQTNLVDFKFKKRKMIIKGLLNGQEEKFLFDSGTSAYELLTNKEVWENLKLPNSKINIEKSQSWDKVLTTYTANCNQKIQISKQEIPLNNVTYVEGFSQAQYSMMKFSGITGMLGNKVFLNNSLYIDCTQNKIGIE
jgi:predicted aspartyl protease